MNRTWYDGEILRQLSDAQTYKEVLLSEIPTQKIYGDIKKIAFTARMAQEPLITGEQYKFLEKKVTPSSCEIPQIYILPKVHKAKLAGRPIIPGYNWITTPSSILIDHLLQPLVKELPTVISDSKSLVTQLNTLRINSQTVRLLTADVSSLYTEIVTNVGIQFVNTFMKEKEDIIPAPLRELIIELLKIVMHNNYFQFKGKFYHQIKGTAMGTPVAVIFANIFMYMLERRVLKKYGEDIVYYKRYLDDIFMIVNGNPDSIKLAFCTMQRNIKLEFQDSDNEAIFLDLNVYKGERFFSSSILDTKIHQKQLNNYLYIPFSSFHPVATKKGFIASELRRYIRNTSSLSEYIAIKKEFWSRLRARGYPPTFLTDIFKNVRYSERDSLLLPSTKLKETDSNTIFLTTEFTPLTKSIPMMKLLQQNLHLLKTSFNVKIGFKKSANLHNELCRNS